MAVRGHTGNRKNEEGVDCTIGALNVGNHFVPRIGQFTSRRSPHRTRCFEASDTVSQISNGIKYNLCFLGELRALRNDCRFHIEQLDKRIDSAIARFETIEGRTQSLCNLLYGSLRCVDP